MHADGVLKLSRTFEHVSPEDVGNMRRILTSEMSGRNALYHKIRRIAPELGRDSPETQRIIEKLREAEQIGYTFEAAEASFELMVRRETGRLPNFFDLIFYKTIGEQPFFSTMSASAVVKLRVGDREAVNAAEGEVRSTRSTRPCARRWTSFTRVSRSPISVQLEAEAMAMAFGKVYTFGPTFRAEKSFTTRHAAEFWMIEPEMAFCDLSGYMDTAEAMTKYVIRYVLDNCPDEMAFFNQFIDKGLIERLELVANSEFGRISYTDAIEILKKNNKKFQFPVEWGVDIQTEHERYLTEVVFKSPSSSPTTRKRSRAST